MFKKNILIILLFMLFICGCKTTSKTINTVPQEIEWGKAGTQPTKVWTDYSWVIVSTEKYLGDN